MPHARAHIQSAVATAQQLLNDPNFRDDLQAIPAAEFTLDRVVAALPFSTTEKDAINKLSAGNKQKIAFAIKAAVDRNHDVNVSWHPSSGTQLVTVTPAATIAEGRVAGLVSILIRSRYTEDQLDELDEPQQAQQGD